MYWKPCTTYLGTTDQPLPARSQLGVATVSLIVATLSEEACAPLAGARSEKQMK